MDTPPPLSGPGGQSGTPPDKHLEELVAQQRKGKPRKTTGRFKKPNLQQEPDLTADANASQGPTGSGSFSGAPPGGFVFSPPDSAGQANRPSGSFGQTGGGFGQAPATENAGFGQAAAPPGNAGFGQAPQVGSAGFGQGSSPSNVGFGQAPLAGNPGFGQGPAPGNAGFGQAPQTGKSGFGQAPTSANAAFGQAPRPAKPGNVQAPGVSNPVYGPPAGNPAQGNPPQGKPPAPLNQAPPGGTVYGPQGPGPGGYPKPAIQWGPARKPQQAPDGTPQYPKPTQKPVPNFANPNILNPNVPTPIHNPLLALGEIPISNSDANSDANSNTNTNPNSYSNQNQTAQQAQREGFPSGSYPAAANPRSSGKFIVPNAQGNIPGVPAGAIPPNPNMQNPGYPGAQLANPHNPQNVQAPISQNQGYPSNQIPNPQNTQAPTPQGQFPNPGFSSQASQVQNSAHANTTTAPYGAQVRPQNIQDSAGGAPSTIPPTGAGQPGNNKVGANNQPPPTLPPKPKRNTRSTKKQRITRSWKWGDETEEEVQEPLHAYGPLYKWDEEANQAELSPLAKSIRNTEGPGVSASEALQSASEIGRLIQTLSMKRVAAELKMLTCSEICFNSVGPQRIVAFTLTRSQNYLNNSIDSLI